MEKINSSKTVKATVSAVAFLFASVCWQSGWAQNPLNPLTQGPHSGGNPHSKLTAQQMLDVAIQHGEAGRHPLALQTLDDAIDRFPNEASLYATRGSLYLSQRKITLALKDLETALNLEPNNPAYLTNRAQAYRSFGRTEEALKDLDLALQIDAKLLAAAFNRGSIHYAKGEYQKALEDFNLCIDIDPHQPGPWFNRAATLKALGKDDKAIADIKQFLKIAQHDEWKKAGEDLLRAWSEQSKQDKNNAS